MTTAPPNPLPSSSRTTSPDARTPPRQRNAYTARSTIAARASSKPLRTYRTAATSVYDSLITATAEHWGMCNHILDGFRETHEIYEGTAAETVEQLGAELAGVFSGFANDIIDISGALMGAYDSEYLVHSILHHDFHMLHQRVCGMHYDFLSGRYEAVRRDLRFTWESIFRCFFADRFRELRPTDRDPPGPALDDKANWLAHPRRRLNWDMAILPVLRYIFSGWLEGEVDAEFGPVWGRLNAAAHPSGEWRESGISDSTRCVWHHFDHSLARELIADARAVFAVVFAAILNHFPRTAAILFKSPKTFANCPQLRFLFINFVRNRASSEESAPEATQANESQTGIPPATV